MWGGGGDVDVSVYLNYWAEYCKVLYFTHYWNQEEHYGNLTLSLEYISPRLISITCIENKL